MTILMYHKIDLEIPTMWWVSSDRFYRQMLELQSKQIVYLDDYDPQNPHHVVITFDGIYKNVFKYAVPILKQFNYPYELFVSSDYIGIDNSFDVVEPLAQFTDWQDLQDLVAANGRLQWHTRSHPDLTVAGMDLLQELDIPDELKALDSHGFKWFAYPYGKFDQEVLEAVKDRFSGAVSCDQGNDLDTYCLNRLTVTNESSFSESKIAVIIASYNYGSFLVEAIESVLRQTRLPHEILISDDASTDNTYEIALSYQRKYPALIKVNRNENNMGIVPHFNKAVRLTDSDYIAILGADNRFRSDYIEKTAQILDKHDDVGIAYTDFALFGQRAKLVYDTFSASTKGAVKGDKFYVINFPEFDSESRQRLLEVENFIHGSSMFRRKAFDRVDGYMQEQIPEDHYLFRRIIKAGWSAKRAPLPLLEYRQHSRHQTNIQLNSFVELQFYKNSYKEMKLELERSHSQLQQTDSQFQHARSELANLQAQFQYTQSELTNLQSQLQYTELELKRSQNLVSSMETSKFWKVRKAWFAFKQMLGIENAL